MATSTTYNDVKVYDEQFQGGFIETLQQNVDAFNAAARGTITLDTQELLGHYEKEAFWDEVSAIARRDITKVSTDTVSKTILTQDEFIGVKLNRRNGPYETNIDAFRKIGRDPELFSRVIGVQTAMAMPKEILDRALAAVEGKLDSVAALEHDATDGTLASADLISGLKKAGDSAQGIVMWVMHSAPFFDLLGNQMAAQASVFGSDAFGSQIFAGMPATLNRPVLVTDSTSLVVTDEVSSGIDAYSTLGLRAGAVTVAMSEPPIAVLEGPRVGSENLYVTWQSEYAYNLKLRGCAWNTGTGINPDNAAVALNTNWVTKVASTKLLPGVIIKSR